MNKMKKFWLPLLSLCFVITAFAQQTNYATELNIHYYNDSINKTDTYISDRCVLDVYYPKNVNNFATVVWFHGGGLTGGEKHIPEALKDKGFCIVAVNYRLSPKVVSPKYIEDAAAATAWVFKNISKRGGNPDQIFISGHSAGGYLSLMIGLDKNWLKTYGIDANSIAGLIPLSPQCITHFTVRKERGIPETQPIIDELAPLFHVRADAPPLILMTGDRELEMLGRYEENAYLMRMMKIKGHKETKLYEFDGYGHGNMPEPSFPLLIDEVRRIVKIKKGL